jgi:hypothetical protein
VIIIIIITINIITVTSAFSSSLVLVTCLPTERYRTKLEICNCIVTIETIIWVNKTMNTLRDIRIYL